MRSLTAVPLAAIAAVKAIEERHELERRVLSIVQAIERHAYRFDHERRLHEGLGQVLWALDGLGAVQHEVTREADRFDFLVGDIVVEVKVGGALSAALGQCTRYLKREDVSALILVGPRRWTVGAELPATVHGKPFRLVRVGRSPF